MDNEISFDSIVALVKPIFEEENALLDEADLRRNLDALVTLGFLMAADDKYLLTFRAMVYSQTSPSISQLTKEEFAQYISRNWWKIAGIVFLLVLLVSVLVSVVTVGIILK